MFNFPKSGAGLTFRSANKAKTRREKKENDDGAVSILESLAIF